VLLHPNRALSKYMQGNFVKSGPRFVSFLSQLLLVQLLCKGQGPLVVADRVPRGLPKLLALREIAYITRAIVCLWGRHVFDIVCLVHSFLRFIFISETPAATSARI
jgi:hypothetical protein